LIEFLFGISHSGWNKLVPLTHQIFTSQGLKHLRITKAGNNNLIFEKGFKSTLVT